MYRARHGIWAIATQYQAAKNPAVEDAGANDGDISSSLETVYVPIRRSYLLLSRRRVWIYGLLGGGEGSILRAVLRGIFATLMRISLTLGHIFAKLLLAQEFTARMF